MIRHPEEIETLDRSDEIAGLRTRFAIPMHSDGRECVYLCGNSLGLQPLSVADYVQAELDDWARYGVEGHFKARTPWVGYHESLTDATAAIVGALPSEVVVMNSLTVNLHLLMASFYRPTSGRHAIAIERMAFPSDRYAASSQIAFHGYDPSTALLEIGAENGGDVIPTDDILRFLDREGPRLALLLLGGVNYYSGQAFDMGAIAAAARRHGVTVGLDLAHAAGNIPLRLHDWGADFAAWCSYKYLNGGPGAPGGAFVHERHARCVGMPRLQGWWGNDKDTRFEMRPEFQGIEGAEGWQMSNAPVLGMSALRASMELFDEVGMDALHKKSLKLTGTLRRLLEKQPHRDWSIITPSDEGEHGAQLSLRVRRNGRDVFSALGEQGVICDWREPDVIRIAPAPMYNTFADTAAFAEIFHSCFHAA